MQKKKKVKPSWKDVKSSIKDFDKIQLIKLIEDLYKLTDNNKHFLHARFIPGKDRKNPYKRKIRNSLYIDVVDNEDFDFCGAEQAIDEYSKAVGDLEGMADLMIYYVECGNKFTVDYGDMDEDFYDTMLDMYDRAIKTILKMPKNKQGIYRKRLKKIITSSGDIGWGYSDGLRDYFYEAFPED